MGLVGDVAAMLGVAGNVASTIMTNNSQESMFHQAQQFNANESAKQRQFVLEQWQRENEYNSPKAQIARLIAAGINPALAYTEGSLANTAAPSSSPSEANSPAPPHLTVPQVDPLTAAQIANINADTEQKKQLTKEKEISNEVGRMNADAFKDAYTSGLVNVATKAGFGRIIDDYRTNRYTLFESAWDFAKLTGSSIATSLSSSDKYLFSGSYDENGYVVDFNFDPNYLRRQTNLQVTSEEAQIEANKAAKMVAELQQQEKRKNFDIYSKLNEEANKGELWAKIALIGLWIAEQRFSLPNISLSIRGSDKSSHASYDYSERKNTIFNK